MFHPLTFKKNVNLMINIWRKADTLKEPIQRPIEATRASMKEELMMADVVTANGVPKKMLKDGV